ncbi:hypothetical protein DY000_02024611 [Brassica cretica]|uniref:CASP-like protein n=1 Tax=Brassica cretica TaxID=69181 RepID=A0ABQ7EDD4_BRACR|nr:hypothetical protein DY000_02024611 [Brassica cretica]
MVAGWGSGVAGVGVGVASRASRSSPELSLLTTIVLTFLGTVIEFSNCRNSAFYKGAVNVTKVSASASAAAAASMRTVVVRFADSAAYYIATAGFIGVSRRTRRSDAASDAASCVNETNKNKNISSSSTVSARMILEGGSGRIPKSSRRGYQLCDSTKHWPLVAGSFGLAFPHPYWRHKMEAGRYRVEVQIVNQKIPFTISMHLVFWFSVSKA